MLTNSDLLATIKDAFDSQAKNNFTHRDEESKEFFLSRIVEKYPPNGRKMIAEINLLNPELVIDLGCGLNQYKGKIKNLVGVDLLDYRADIVSDITDLSQHFSSNVADVVLALGSINFGDDELIKKQLAEVKRLLKPQGLAYFRANLNDHDPEHKGKLHYYGWSKDKVSEWSSIAGFELVGGVLLEEGRPGVKDRMDREFVGNERSKSRLFWKWKSL